MSDKMEDLFGAVRDNIQKEAEEDYRPFEREDEPSGSLNSAAHAAQAAKRHVAAGNIEKARLFVQWAISDLVRATQFMEE